MNARSTTHEGVLSALTAYVIWGLVPIYFKQLGNVPALEIIAHRVLWSLLLVGGYLAARRALVPFGFDPAQADPAMQPLHRKVRDADHQIVFADRHPSLPRGL